MNLRQSGYDCVCGWVWVREREKKFLFGYVGMETFDWVHKNVNEKNKIK